MLVCSQATCVDAAGSNTLSLSHATSLEVSSSSCIASDGSCALVEGIFDQPASTTSLAGRPFSDQLIAMFRCAVSSKETPTTSPTPYCQCMGDKLC